MHETGRYISRLVRSFFVHPQFVSLVFAFNFRFVRFLVRCSSVLLYHCRWFYYSISRYAVLLSCTDTAMPRPKTPFQYRACVFFYLVSLLVPKFVCPYTNSLKQRLVCIFITLCVFRFYFLGFYFIPINIQFSCFSMNLLLSWFLSTLAICRTRVDNCSLAHSFTLTIQMLITRIYFRCFHFAKEHRGTIYVIYLPLLTFVRAICFIFQAHFFCSLPFVRMSHFQDRSLSLSRYEFYCRKKVKTRLRTKCTYQTNQKLCTRINESWLSCDAVVIVVAVVGIFSFVITIVIVVVVYATSEWLCNWNENLLNTA